MRLKDKFKQLKKEGRKAFIAYVTFGFPSIKLTKDICLTLQDCGVDAIELGIPFSDPLADGPIIQYSTAQALKKGANIDNFFGTLNSLKPYLHTPLVVMSYYNPIFKFGLDNFLRRMNQLKANALAIVDLPLEESQEYIKKARKFNIDTIFFITPTTSYQRSKKIVKQSRGFIYYISVTGITGPKDFNYSPLERQVRSIKKITDLPVCVGFGIHNRKQVKKINRFSDGVIIGSSIVRFIENNFRKKDFLRKLKTYIKSLQDYK